MSTSHHSRSFGQPAENTYRLAEAIWKNLKELGYGR